MLRRLQRLMGSFANKPGWDLSDYPPYDMPFPGYGKALSEAQAQQNQAYFHATLNERQQRLRDWLMAHEGPDPRALQGSACAKALNIWAKAHWPMLPAHAGLPPHQPWPACPRHGPFIVYSLLGDLGVSLGEATYHADDDWRWGLNLDAIELADGMHTSRRVVLLADLKHPTPETSAAVLDLEALVVSAYRFPNSPDFVYLDSWSRTVADAIKGAYHRR